MTTPSNGTEPSAPINDQDLELMRFLDGELDEAEASDFADRLQDDEVAQAKLAGLELVGELLIESVQADERADSIVSAVMAKLDEEQKEQEQEQDQPNADVVPIAPQPNLRPKPANDNSKSILALVAAAAAVAAGLFFWGRTNPATGVAQAPYEPPAVAAEMPTSVKPAPEESASLAAVEEEMDQVGMEIAAVDFGSQQGSVFYVGGSNDANATTVVWVTESGDDQ